MKKSIKILLFIIFLLVLIMIGLICVDILIRKENKAKENTVFQEQNKKEIEAEEAEPIKWDNYNIEVNAEDNKIDEYMQKHNNNAYILNINDERLFKEAEEELEIECKDEEKDIDNISFDKYNVLIVVFMNIRALHIDNVLSYTDNNTIEFAYEEDRTLQERISFCILIPKENYKNDIDIVYIDKYQEIPETATRGKCFYIRNVENFENMNFEYDKDKDIYYSKILNKDEYNEISNKLRIVNIVKLFDEEIEGKNIFLIFKKTDKKIMGTFEPPEERERIPYISISETDEQYGKGITGIMIITEENFSIDNVIIEEN